MKDKRITAVAAAIAGIVFLMLLAQAKTGVEAAGNAVGSYLVFLIVRWGLRKAV